MAKTKKTAKKILLALLIFIVAATAAVYGVFNFYIKPEYGEKIIEAVSSVFDDDEFKDELSEALADEEIAQLTGEAEGVGTDGENAAATSSGESTQNQSGGEGEQPVQENTDTQPQQSASSTTTKSSGKKQTLMEKARANVDPADFADGMRIASKVDTGYLMGLMSGGLTAEEKAEAKKYLKSRLTSAEISRVKKYIAKYSYLLSD